jgi:dimethylhistidine N-methyltransferase
MPIQTKIIGPFTLQDGAPDATTFRAEIVAGLSARPKRLPAKFFYDRAGSRLFDEICELEEYYLTRTELGILDRFVAEMAESLGPNPLVVELGSGSGQKTRKLLAALRSPAAYVPVDIARDELITQAALLTDAFAGLELLPVCADYTRPFTLPVPRRASSGIAFYFPGSTIGNLEPTEAAAFLAHLKKLAGGRCQLLLGVDLKKDPRRLSAAYADARGVTAAFNLNLLARINRELGGDFDLASFRHRAVYAEGPGRIEMYLDSTRAQRVTLGDHGFDFAAGEGLCTEHSYKYDPADVARLAAAGGFTKRRSWTDPEQLFSVELLEAA